MGLLDKVKSQAELAATKAREGVQEVQLKRELGQAQEELGKLTFELVESGELAHDRLTPLVEKVRDLTARLAEDEPAAVAPTTTTTAEPPVESGPPAMPT